MARNFSVASDQSLLISRTYCSGDSKMVRFVLAMALDRPVSGIVASSTSTIFFFIVDDPSLKPGLAAVFPVIVLTQILLRSNTELAAHEFPDNLDILDAGCPGDFDQSDTGIVALLDVLQVPDVDRADLPGLDEADAGALGSLGAALRGVQNEGAGNVLALHELHPLRHAVQIGIAGAGGDEDEIRRGQEGPDGVLVCLDAGRCVDDYEIDIFAPDFRKDAGDIVHRDRLD